MNTFKISITKYESSPDYYVYTNRGREFLFRFYQSSVDSTVRYFTLPENERNSLYVVSEEFPVDYLLELARAVLICRYGIIDLDVRLTMEAKKTLGVK